MDLAFLLSDHLDIVLGCLECGTLYPVFLMVVDLLFADPLLFPWVPYVVEAALTGTASLFLRTYCGRVGKSSSSKRGLGLTSILVENGICIAGSLKIGDSLQAGESRALIFCLAMALGLS